MALVSQVEIFSAKETCSELARARAPQKSLTDLFVTLLFVFLLFCKPLKLSSRELRVNISGRPKINSDLFGRH